MVNIQLERLILNGVRKPGFSIMYSISQLYNQLKIWLIQDSSRIADFDAIEEDYAFAGMSHIFDQHIGSAVTCLSFARSSKSVIALGSADGSVSICSVDQNPSVDKVLDARSGPISRLEWSSNNEFMVTASQTGLSGKLIVWRVNSGERLRQFEWNKSCNSKSVNFLFSVNI